jgi:hypothetical protein
MDMLEEEGCYKHWTKYDKSCLLMMSGKNHSILDDTTLCWLSPIAISIVEKLRGSGEAKVAYYCCQTARRQVGDPPTFQETLSSIIAQVLRWNPRILRTKYEEFTRCVNNAQWKHQHRGIEARFTLLKILLDLSGPGTVYIVLDRVDRCSGARPLFLEGLASLVKEDGCIVKILVVIDSGRWQKRDMDIENLEKGLGRRFVKRLEWDQNAKID